MTPPIGFLPCCCAGCKWCGDGLTPDEIIVTGSGFIDRTIITGSAAGFVVSPLSVFNRAHTLPRIYAGTLDQWFDPEGPPGEISPSNPCIVLYRAEFEFGDAFIGGKYEAETDPTNEDYWLRDLLYYPMIGFQTAVTPAGPSRLTPWGDGFAPTMFLVGSWGPGVLGTGIYFEGLNPGEVGGTPSNSIPKSAICSTPAAVSISSPGDFVLMRISPAGGSPWYRAALATSGFYTLSTADTGGDPAEQTGAALSLIASAGRS